VDCFLREGVVVADLMLVRLRADAGVFAFGVFFAAMPSEKGAISLVEVAKSKVDFCGVADLGGGDHTPLN